MISSVARKSPHATDDIINYTKKKKNYIKEQKELAAANPAAAGASSGGGGPPPKPGSLASSERLIRTFLKKKGVTETNKGVKFGGKTLSFAYDDMIADLTKNVKKKYTNLTAAQHAKLLKELKKTGMPVGYIRSENLRNQYRELDGGTPQTQTPPPAYQTAPPGIVTQQQPSFSFIGATPMRSQKGKPCRFMFNV
jgi:hypothetical protein